MKKRKRLAIFAILLSGAALAGCANTQSVLNPHGNEAIWTASLAWLMFAIALIVLIIVTVLIFMTAAKARRTETATDLYRDDGKALRNVMLGGGVAPIIILLIVMSLAIGVGNASHDQSVSAKGTLDIEVIGHQWWWEVHYTNQDFITANEIHIPVRQQVKIHVTSADVIHSFWVPELHGKIDTIPGQTNTITLEAEQAGVYRGQCAEYCGDQHANMAFVVIADSQADFDKWLKGQEADPVQPAEGSLEQTGQQVFLGSSCVYCHTIRGTNASGKVGPDLSHLASRSTIGSGILPNNAGNLSGWILNSQAIKPGNHMPPMDLNGDQIQALLAYLSTLK